MAIAPIPRLVVPPDDLVEVVPVPALVVALLAFILGFTVAFLAVSLVLDRQPPFKVLHPKDAVTVLIAARNEEAGIGETLRYLAAQDYEGSVTVVLVDSGSTDATVKVARSVAKETGLRVRVISELTPGKCHALNRGLRSVRTNLVVTVDADTLLHRSALRLLVARLKSLPSVTAVAGCVLVRNSRRNLWTRLQAFSMYRTKAVRSAGGWPDAIGEDIVLT